MDNNKKHDIETDKVTPIQLIMLVIVLVFFIGAVVLYFLNAAPIILAFILAAGGAVLVHYFLGGIARQTRFLWFGLKVGGALAALLGITYGANHYLEKQTRMASAGEYEWQWAGDGWIGYIDVGGRQVPDSAEEIHYLQWPTSAALYSWLGVPLHCPAFALTKAPRAHSLHPTTHEQPVSEKYIPGAGVRAGYAHALCARIAPGFCPVAHNTVFDRR